MNRSSRLFGIVLTTALGVAVQAQNYTFQEISNNAYGGIGTLSSTGNFLVNDSGNWYLSTRLGAQTQLQSFNGNTIWANALNSLGTMVGGSTKVGHSTLYGDLYQATTWINGVPTALNPGGESSEVLGIGDDGTIYGHTVNHPSGVATSQGWIYKNGTFTFLSNGNNYNDPSFVRGGTTSGLSIGSSNNPEKATIWQGTTKTVIGGQGGYQYSQARDVNSAGQVLVSSFYDYGNAKGRADIYDHGSWINIGTYNGDAYFQAGEINDLGQVIGTGYDSQGYRQSMLMWQAGVGFTNLTNLQVDPNQQTYSIGNLNDAGEFMVRTSRFIQSGYEYHTYIATPSTVPEPASILALTVGSALFFRRRNRA